MPHPRIAVCSWSLRPESPDELIEAMKRLDIHSVQLALRPLLENPAVWRGSIDALAAAGIRTISGMMGMAGEDYSTLESIAATGGVRPDSTWPRNQDLARRIAALAADAGIGLVTFHAGFLPEDVNDPERAVLLDRLQNIASIFAECEIQIALETGQETASILAAALDSLSASNLGVNFDPANMILYGKGDPVCALRDLAPSVRQIHIKDALPAAMPGIWGEEVPVGMGAVDWDEFFRIAVRITPPVNFVIEREAGATRERDIAAARDLIMKLMGA